MGGEQVIMVSITDIKPHPRNKDFFDDVTGEKWDDFVESIKTNGILQPLILTQDNVVVSGNQRLRGGKEAQMTELPCIIRHYDRDCDVIKDLIEINLQQRGTISTSKRKQGMIARALEEAYGIQYGGKNKYNSNLMKSGNSTLHQNTPEIAKLPEYQSDIAAMMGVTLDQYKAAISVLNLVPELQEATEDGRIPPSAAQKLLNKLSEEDQLDLVSRLPATAKVKTAELEEMITKYTKAEAEKELAVEAQKAAEKAKASAEYDQKQKQKEIERLQQPEAVLEKNERERYEKMLEEMKDKYENAAKTITSINTECSKLRDRLAIADATTTQYKEKEVKPSDYDALKAQAHSANSLREELEIVREELAKAKQNAQGVIVNEVGQDECAVAAQRIAFAADLIASFLDSANTPQFWEGFQDIQKQKLSGQCDKIFDNTAKIKNSLNKRVSVAV